MTTPSSPPSVDLSHGASFANGFPHEFFTWLRAHDPVHWHEPTEHTPGGEGFWVVSRYEDVGYVIRNPQLFSSAVAGGRKGGGTSLEDREEFVNISLNATDDPKHRRLRGLISQGFTPKAIQQLQSEIEERAHQLFDQVSDLQHFDFVHEVARELPLQMICSMLGVPLDERAELARAIDGGGESIERRRESLRRLYRQPGMLPERDCFVGLLIGRQAGCATLHVEEAIGRGVLECGVHPGARSRGVGRALVDAAVAHARGLGLEVLDFDAPEGDEAAARLFGGAGFAVVRRHLHLRIEGLAPPPQREAQGRVVRALRREEAPALTEIQNAAFTGSWGYCPNTPEQLDYRIYELPLDHPDDVVVVEEEGRLVGYCWAQRRGRGEPGVVGMVGVLPEAQGRGVGWAATAASLAALAEAGAQPIDITVDEANTPAVNLYRSLGFETAWRSVWYRRDLSA